MNRVVAVDSARAVDRAARQEKYVARCRDHTLAVKRAAVHLGVVIRFALNELGRLEREEGRRETWRARLLAAVQPLLAPEQLQDDDLGHVRVIRQRRRAVPRDVHVRRRPAAVRTARKRKHRLEQLPEERGHRVAREVLEPKDHRPRITRSRHHFDRLVHVRGHVFRRGGLASGTSSQLHEGRHELAREGFEDGEQRQLRRRPARRRRDRERLGGTAGGDARQGLAQLRRPRRCVPRRL